MRSLFALFLALAALASPASAQSMLEGEFDPAIPTLEEVVGHRSGAQITAPDAILTYFRALEDAAPDRFRIVEYATSWEGRPLVYAVVTSAANMTRIDEIEADLRALERGAAPSPDALPVTWLSYGVHGDEISSSDAALVLAYHLLASEGSETVDTILGNSVVVIDPNQNPDGRARFVNSYYAQLGIAPSPDPYTAGHDQPWPGGRYNHYLFDLNRDWFAMTQPETRGRVAAIRRWQPVVVVDAHEMGGDETYFFPPSADPFNPNITQGQRQKQVLLGRNIAQWMDRLGEPYFTREIFDAFYPGYGDTWPTLNGAIAMTFEQGSARGLVWERPDGSLLTYGEGVRNHFITTLATAETVARNPELFLGDYARYRQEAASGAAGTGTYVIDRATRSWNAAMLARRLAEQGISVTSVEGPASACGRSYPEGYFAIDRRQPSARLVRSLLDRDTELPAEFVAGQEERRDRSLAHEIYDTTAWSVGLMSGADVELCSGAAPGSPLDPAAPLPDRTEAPGVFGLAVPWNDSGQVRLVARALAQGFRGRATDTAFTASGRTFPRGTVVFTNAANDADLTAINALAREIGAETVALASGWVEDGPNLGSASFVPLSMPRVAMLWDDGIDPTSAGSVRYTLEQRLGIPVAPIRTGTVAGADLDRYDVLIVPDGDPASALREAGHAAIESYARNGGVVIVLGSSLRAFSGTEGALLSTARETVLGGEPEDEEAAENEETAETLVAGEAIESEEEYRQAIADPTRSPDTLPGALLDTRIDADSYLSAGYDADAPVVFAGGSLVFAPLSRADGINVVHFAPAEELVVSGLMWEENRRQMAFKPYMMAQGAGDGLAIGFAHDPTVRGYLDGLDLLLANAVIMAPARVR